MGGAVQRVNEQAAERNQGGGVSPPSLLGADGPHVLRRLPRQEPGVLTAQEGAVPPKLRRKLVVPRVGGPDPWVAAARGGRVLAGHVVRHPPPPLVLLPLGGVRGQADCIEHLCGGEAKGQAESPRGSADEAGRGATGL